MWKMNGSEAIYDGKPAIRMFVVHMAGGVYVVRYGDGEDKYNDLHDIAFFTRYADAAKFMKRFIADLNAEDNKWSTNV